MLKKGKSNHAAWKAAKISHHVGLHESLFVKQWQQFQSGQMVLHRNATLK